MVRRSSGMIGIENVNQSHPHGVAGERRQGMKKVVVLVGVLAIALGVAWGVSACDKDKAAVKASGSGRN